MFNEANSITLTVPETQDYLAKVRKNMIGFDDWFTNFDQHFSQQNNYPPYNTIQKRNACFGRAMLGGGVVEVGHIVFFVTFRQSVFRPCRRGPNGCREGDREARGARRGERERERQDDEETREQRQVRD